MITITKFPYRRRCEMNLCSCLGVHAVGEENGPARLRQIYCEDHLIELGKAIALKFPEEFPTGNIAELEDKERQIVDLKQQLDAKTTAHECLKEQLADLKKAQEKPVPKTAPKTANKGAKK
jgi:hypothetical protein